MSKRKKTPPMIADPKAVKAAAGEIESQVKKMCQAVPASLQDIFNRGVVLQLLYNSQAQVKIFHKNRQEAEVWLANYLAAPLKAWRPFGVEFSRHHWHGDMFIVILKKK